MPEQSTGNPAPELSPAGGAAGDPAVAPMADAAPVVSAVPDATLLAAHDLAREALLEITPADSIGPVAGHIVEGERVLSLLFECTLPGYPGWHWTITLARIDDESEPAVLEAELLPGDEALVAPDWVPWSVRLAEYQAAQQEARAAGDEPDDALHDAELENDEADDDSEDSDDDDLDDDDLEDADDIDGVDIDLHDIQSRAESGDDDDSDTDDDGEGAGADDVDDDPDEDADIDLEADDITGAESASLELGVDESDEAEDDADDRGGEHPAGA